MNESALNLALVHIYLKKCYVCDYFFGRFLSLVLEGLSSFEIFDALKDFDYIEYAPERGNTWYKISIKGEEKAKQLISEYGADYFLRAQEHPEDFLDLAPSEDASDPVDQEVDHPTPPEEAVEEPSMLDDAIVLIKSISSLAGRFFRFVSKMIALGVKNYRKK